MCGSASKGGGGLEQVTVLQQRLPCRHRDRGEGLSRKFDILDQDWVVV